MQANWSLILNVLLLIGVVAAIGRLMKARRQSLSLVSSSRATENKHFDEVIVVRKIGTLQSEQEDLGDVTIKAIPAETTDLGEEKPTSTFNESSQSLVMFLLAKENRQLAGYELLQTVLTAGLRFGEGQLFHRHQYPNGQGPVLCSLAAATASGVFDLQSIGAFSARGLCLFMQASGNPTIDAERFAIMLETARQLSDGLDTYLLDDKQQPLSDASVARYQRLLNLNSTH
jgi:cell division protein ZipA